MHALTAAALAVSGAPPAPTPTPQATPLPTIVKVHVATGSAQSLHALPVDASALDPAAVRNSSSYTSDALLRNLPGFDRNRSNSLFTNYGQLRVSFAGAGNDRGLVLADGIPAQDGFGGQIDWAAYPASDIQRAELLVGAGSALYGAGAVGGVLDIETFGPAAPSSRPGGSLYISAGSDGFIENWANLAMRLAPRLSASLGLQQERLQYYALPPPYASPIDRISQADAAMAAVRVGYRASSEETIEVRHRAAWDDQFEGRPNYTFSRRLNQTDVRYTRSTPRATLQSALYSRTAFVANLADQFPSKPGVERYVQYVPTHETGAVVRWIAGGRGSTLEIAADARHVGGVSTQYTPSSSLQSAGAGLQNLLGVAAQETWQKRRFELVAGARFDAIRSYGQQLVTATNGKPAVTAPAAQLADAISPRLAVRYDVSPQLALRASAGSGLRAPFLNELVRGYFIGATEFEPNPFLDPERSHTTSEGIDLVTVASHLSFDAFDTTVNDAIMFRTIDPTHQVRGNVARTQTQAYSASYTRDIGKCSRVSGWLTSENARVAAGPAAIVGKRLQYVPAVSASLDYLSRIGMVTAGVSLSYLGQTYADDLNSQPLGTAILAGLRLHIPVAGTTIDIRVDNLTGARYLSSIDRYGPPALISIGVALPVGSAVPKSVSAADASSP